jgi:hypothetical protein
MNYRLVADTLDVKARSSRPERPEAHGNPKNPVDMRPDRHELRKRIVRR